MHTLQTTDTSIALSPEARALALDSKAPSTLAAWDADWARFSAYAESRGELSCPAHPATVASYIATLHGEGYAVNTIARAVAGISAAHRHRGCADVTKHAAVADVLAGVKRRAAIAGDTPRQVSAVSPDMLARGLPSADTLAGLRDRALVLVGFFAARRRSEIVALTVADCVRSPNGYAVTVRRSKTDQTGKGHTVHLHTRADALCPVVALDAWLVASGISEGPVFRRVTAQSTVGSNALTAQVVALVVKACAERAGCDPDAFAGHSLRRGLATAAANSGASIDEIAAIGGWARGSKVVHRYIESAAAFQNKATTRF